MTRTESRRPSTIAPLVATAVLLSSLLAWLLWSSFDPAGDDSSSQRNAERFGAGGTSPQRSSQPAGASGRPQRVPLKDAGFLEIRITDPGGRPIEGAAVEVRRWILRASRRAAGMATRRETNRDGVVGFRKPQPGSYTVEVAAREYGPVVRRLAVSDRTDVIRIVLTPLGVVRGVVVQGGGEPLPGCDVVLTPYRAMDESNLAFELRSVRRAVTSVDGSFEFRGVPRQQYELVCMARDMVMVPCRPVAVVPDARPVQIVMRPVLGLRLVYVDGRTRSRVPGAVQVRLRVKCDVARLERGPHLDLFAGRLLPGVSRDRLREVHGRELRFFVLGGAPGNWRRGVPADVEVQVPGFRRRRLHVRLMPVSKVLPDGSALVVRLEPQAGGVACRLRFAYEDGSRMLGWRFVNVSDSSGKEIMGWTLAAGGGELGVTAYLRPGRWWVRVGAVASSLQDFSFDVPSEGRLHQFDFRLKRGADLVIGPRTANGRPAPYWVLGLRGLDEGNASVRLGRRDRRDGAPWVLRDLPPGRYRIELSDMVGARDAATIAASRGLVTRLTPRWWWLED